MRALVLATAAVLIAGPALAQSVTTTTTESRTTTAPVVIAPPPPPVVVEPQPGAAYQSTHTVVHADGDVSRTMRRTDQYVDPNGATHTQTTVVHQNQ